MTISAAKAGKAASAVLGVALLVPGLAACTGTAASTGKAGSAGQVKIQVSAPVALFDQPIKISVTGLPAGKPVTITAQATDANNETWQGKGTFVAGPDGVVNLSSAAPRDGTYQGPDGMGLFWSMVTTIPSDPGNEYFAPDPPQQQPSLPVRLAVSSGGRLLASTVVTRRWLAPGETAKVLNPPSAPVSGVLFLPPPGTARHPAVLVFGGAEGGMSQTFTAALLAAHGYPALTVAYFQWPGQPTQLQNIPLEYFVAAERILASQPGVDPAHILVMGYSRGSEAALLLADNFPRLFHGAIVYSPSADVNPSAVDDSEPAWTLRGKPVWPRPIAVNKISGPVLAFAGASDALWNSGGSAAQISSELGMYGKGYPHQALIYNDAGHGVGTFPYQPIGDAALQALGGTRAGDVTAQRSGWAMVLSLLARLG